jgi:hypothetical protein
METKKTKGNKTAEQEGTKEGKGRKDQKQRGKTKKR